MSHLIRYNFKLLYCPSGATWPKGRGLVLSPPPQNTASTNHTGQRSKWWDNREGGRIPQNRGCLALSIFWDVSKAIMCVPLEQVVEISRNNSCPLQPTSVTQGMNLKAGQGFGLTVLESGIGDRGPRTCHCSIFWRCCYLSSFTKSMNYCYACTHLPSLNSSSG